MSVGHEHAGRAGIAPAGRSTLFSGRTGIARDLHNPMPTKPVRCTGIKNDGTACKASPANGTLFCAGHLRKRGEL